MEGRGARAAQQNHLLHGPSSCLAPRAPSGEPHFWWRNKQVPLRPAAWGEAAPEGPRPRGSPGSRRSREFPVGSRGHPRFASRRPPGAPPPHQCAGGGQGAGGIHARTSCRCSPCPRRAPTAPSPGNQGREMPRWVCTCTEVAFARCRGQPLPLQAHSRAPRARGRQDVPLSGTERSARGLSEAIQVEL